MGMGREMQRTPQMAQTCIHMYFKLAAFKLKAVMIAEITAHGAICDIRQMLQCWWGKKLQHLDISCVTNC